ncbi:MAG: glycosyltransferase [Desulfobacterales bacterium]|nr:glycosyltransferase [Desulfobacterales bacterium]
MKKVKVDLHVHSKYSKRPSSWVLKKIGCAESYTEPKNLYNIAIERGMDLVTITDHNTIAGSLEIAHLNNTFISEEITTYFPNDGCKVHVLAFGVNEKNHEDITKLRNNIFELVEYLNHKNIHHAIAHPMFAVNDRLTLEHFEQLIVLFNIFELNGTRDDYQNKVLTNILENLKQEDIEYYSNKYKIKPYGQKPWEKFITGGSDDHSALNIASTYTEMNDVASVDDFLKGLGKNKTTASGIAGSPKKMAHNLYSIAYQFYKTKLPIDRYVNKDPFFKFTEKVLLLSKTEERLSDKLLSFIASQKQKYFFNNTSEKIQDMIRKEAKDIIVNDKDIWNLIQKENPLPEEMTNVWFKFVDNISEKILKKFADSTLNSFYRGNLFDIFQTIGSVGSLYMMLAPYFIAYTLLKKDRNFTNKCYNRFVNSGKINEAFKMAHFTDTFNDINGVSKTLKMQANIAEKFGKNLTIITCGDSSEIPKTISFQPIGTFELPEYSSIKIYYPPILKMIEYCYEQNFTHIHSATPGPIGLAALLISKILNIPIYGTYHTAFPQYVKQFTGDTSMEDMTWKYILWYYNQMNVVYVPSKSTGDELKEKGISEEKIVCYPRGIDTDSFHPSKRNGFFKQFKITEANLKIIYVGRVSKEKNLPILSETFKQLCNMRKNIHLVVVGDGPYKSEMEQDLSRYPALFTGFLKGEDLRRAYAASDLFIFPSTTDTFGNVVLEAQSSGIPVIVTDKGGPKENMIYGKTGFMVKANDIEGFINASINLIDNPLLLSEMKKNARDYMENRSFEAAYLNLWDMYRQGSLKN